jgi:hypothetical protein
VEHRNFERTEGHPANAGRNLDVSADLSDDEAVGETTDTPEVENDSQLVLGGDTGFDRVVGAEDAGLGGGLDQAEEAQLGITDEELARLDDDEEI